MRCRHTAHKEPLSNLVAAQQISIRPSPGSQGASEGSTVGRRRRTGSSAPQHGPGCGPGLAGMTAPAWSGRPLVLRPKCTPTHRQNVGARWVCRGPRVLIPTQPGTLRSLMVPHTCPTRCSATESACSVAGHSPQTPRLAGPLKNGPTMNVSGGQRLLTVVDPADDSVIQDADRYRRFGRQRDGFVGRVRVVRHAFPKVSSAW